MVGRHKREEKQSLGSAQGGHSYAPLQTHNVLMRSVPHSQHKPCPTELTRCGEGSMTREGSAWWGDINEKRNKVKKVHKGGIPMHHSKPITSSCGRCRTASTTLAQPNSLAAVKEARQGREAHGGET